MSSNDKSIFTEKINEVASLNDLRLIYDQAESRNKGLNENGDSLYNKSIIVLGITITALTSLIVYLSDKPPTFSAKYFVCCELILLFIVICLKLQPIIKMDDYYGSGATPKSLLHNDFFTDLENGRSPEWYILQRLIEDYEKKIVSNADINKKRATNLKSAIDWIYWAIGVAIITYLLFYVFGFS